LKSNISATKQGVRREKKCSGKGGGREDKRFEWAGGPGDWGRERSKANARRYL